ncbi:MAG: tRNA threonylcarbamoyladenosine biosynthesis protein TsaE [Candidatus Saccharimonadales bacterium]|jgi:tRNA threonylcarbamoyladenosine biosynthesis protein TsaE
MKNTVTLMSEEDTANLATVIGRNLVGGECIEFVSDLGGGKTTFTRSIVSGAGSTDVVSSPTFTIMKRYSGPQLEFYHYDFYRLDEPGLVAEELAEVVDDKQAVTIIEWAETVREVLPASRLKITLKQHQTSENARECELEYPDKMTYLLKGAML